MKLPGELSRIEFVAMVAALMAFEALPIDVMLPALPDIGIAFGVANPNDYSLVITFFLLGFGLPQVIFGPILDTVGRRRPILVGLVVYIICALASPIAGSFAALLAVRFVQGLACAAIRVGILAAVRDRYEGTAMSEIMSVALSIFLLVPIFVPSIGQIILLFGPWQWIFVVVGVAAIALGVWTWVRLPETLPVAARRPLSFRSTREAFALVLGNRTAISYGLATGFLAGIIIAMVTTAQQVYAGIYGLGPLFPVAFGATAALSSVAFFVNSYLVARLGMRRLAHGALALFTALSLVWFLVCLAGSPPFWVFMAMMLVSIPLVAFGFPNAGALSMIPLGEVAGTASAIFGAIQTVGGALLGYAVAQGFDGTLRPLMAGYFIYGLAALACFLVAEKGRLFATDSGATETASA